MNTQEHCVQAAHQNERATPQVVGDPAGIDPLLGEADARSALGGIGRTLFYDLINRGVLETVKIGRRRLVKSSSVARLARDGWEA